MAHLSRFLTRGVTALLLLGVVCFPLVSADKATITKRLFGKMQDGTPVDLFTLKSQNLEATITNYGGRIVTLRVPDKNGAVADVMLGFDTFDDYLARNSFFGALVGRFAGRMAHGVFTLNGTKYTLGKAPTAEHSIHGGVRGFNKILWNAKVDGDALVLTYLSKDGEEGYPGNLSATVKYRLRDKELEIEYSATTDKATVVNMTNHSFFNLAGEGNGDILNHEIRIVAGRYIQGDKSLIPTGEIKSVEGTPLDFRKSTRIGERISEPFDQLQFGRGYDLNYVLDSGGGKLALAARVKDPSSGRVMEVLTTEPGLQFYTGNGLNATPGKGGKNYVRYGGLCLETQHYPNSPNEPKFPSTELKPGQKYLHRTVFRFSAE